MYNKKMKPVVILLIFIMTMFSSLACADHRDHKISYDLKVSFDLNNSKIYGVSNINVYGKKEITLYIGNLIIKDITLNEKITEYKIQDGKLIVLLKEGGNLTIKYEGIFGYKQNSDKNYGAIQNTINERGIFLTGTWYPQLLEGLPIYKLQAVLPEDFEAISEAEYIKKISRGNETEFVFDFSKPTDNITFTATNRYEIIKESFNDIDLYAYFFPEDIELARKYLDYTKKYLLLYEKMLGKFPYSRFSIVENFLPTGYSMPTYTVLGQDVVKLPFIVETSLGHEILHQWFGNYVYIDYEKGNWAEGLTTYLADHLYEDQKGRGWEYRKKLMTDYESYVRDDKEIALKDFISRTDFLSRAIGYGKASMVFHMLKKMVGEDIFYKSIRDIVSEKKLQRASWNDFKIIFERNSGKDLTNFFTQWIDEKGIPDIDIENLTVKAKGSNFELSFDVFQKNKTYLLEIPLTIYYLDNEKTEKILTIDSERKRFEFLLDSEPHLLVIDENYDIFRRLTPDELQPVIGMIIGEECPIIALPVKNIEFYEDIINSYREKNCELKEYKNIKNIDLKNSSLVILGNDNPLIESLFGKQEPIEGGFSLIVKRNPWNYKKGVGIINGLSKEEVDLAYKKIIHYGKYSIVSFDRGRNILKKIQDAQRGLRKEIMDFPLFIETSSIKPLPGLIESLLTKKIIYIGESHDKFSHHNIQMQIIKRLYKENKKIAIGMEMFQRPFQKYIDDYINEIIDEREFLRRTEYFKRWGFDYNLYKPIIDFARKEKIPVIALNIKREIIDKVSSQGIDSLSEEEKREIPAQLDFTDENYKKFLKDIFDQHPSHKNFDFFYQSQVLWDETMSLSIDEFLREKTDNQMIVIVGSGHLIYGYGIPQRTFRRNGYEYSIVLNDEEIKTGISNFIVFPKPLDGFTSPKLMITLKETDGKVKIEGFTPGSVAEMAGLKKGDVILALDDISVNNIDDIRVHLFFKQKGDKVKVKVLRRLFLIGDREKSFEVIL